MDPSYQFLERRLSRKFRLGGASLVHEWIGQRPARVWQLTPTAAAAGAVDPARAGAAVGTGAPLVTALLAQENLLQFAGGEDVLVVRVVVEGDVRHGLFTCRFKIYLSSRQIA